MSQPLRNELNSIPQPDQEAPLVAFAMFHMNSRRRPSSPRSRWLAPLDQRQRIFIAGHVVEPEHSNLFFGLQPIQVENITAAPSARRTHARW